MTKTLVAVIGPGEGASERDCGRAFELGRAIAAKGWVLISGGRAHGVMHEVNRGAKDAGGLTVGILPSIDRAEASPFVDVAILTGLGQARNNVNVLTGEIVFACGMSAGTASEVSLALKAGRHVILLDPGVESRRFFASLDSGRIHVAVDVTAALDIAQQLLTVARKGDAG